MIVELIGCAGAGKTTLRRILCEEGLPGRTVVAMPDLVRTRPLLGRVEHPTALNVVQDVAGLPYFVRSWADEREFVAFARELLWRSSVSTFDRLNGFRGIVRKLGMYQLATRRAPDRIVISDEGTVLSAYNLLVPTDVDFGRPEVERFLGLVPLPERVVLLRVPVSTLVVRATSRPDPRRQHVGRSRSQIEHDVRRTVELFELVATSTRLESRVLVVHNDDSSEAERRRLARKVGAWLAGSATIPPAPATRATATLLGGA